MTLKIRKHLIKLKTNPRYLLKIEAISLFKDTVTRTKQSDLVDLKTVPFPEVLTVYWIKSRWSAEFTKLKSIFKIFHIFLQKFSQPPSIQFFKKKFNLNSKTYLFQVTKQAKHMKQPFRHTNNNIKLMMRNLFNSLDGKKIFVQDVIGRRGVEVVDKSCFRGAGSDDMNRPTRIEAT